METNLDENKTPERAITNSEQQWWMNITMQEYCDTYSECSEEEWEIIKMEADLRNSKRITSE
ncbi:MAG TPA: hypothetical protein PLN13_13560 [Bacteroidia bacterium]|nr:hypothetical protein [Bacteroidia bacterium]HRH09603.1 hypothetical protein [Bacteroidia bacterium]